MGASVVKPTTYYAVQVGESRWIHARSSARVEETVCGLQSSGGAFAFTDTDRVIDCPFCVRAMGPGRAA